MTILVQNLTNETKRICRFGGQRLYILPNNFITFECTNTQEVSYWSKQSIKDLSSIGIKIIIDTTIIATLIKIRNSGKLTSGVINTDNEVVKDIVNTVKSNVELTSNDSSAEAIKVEKVDTPTENVVEVPSTVEETVDNVENDVEKEVIVEDVEATVETDTIPAVEEETEVETINDTDTETTDTIEETTSTEVEYTEEYLSTLSKEELQDICINKDIPFKKNNSVSTLINLILNA